MLTTWVFQTVQGSAKELKNHTAAFKSIQQIYSIKLYLCARDLHSLIVTKSETGYGTGLFVWLFSQAVSLLDCSTESTEPTDFPLGSFDF